MLEKLILRTNIATHQHPEGYYMLGPMPGMRRQGSQWLDDLCDWLALTLTQLVTAAETDTRIDS